MCWVVARFGRADLARRIPWLVTAALLVCVGVVVLLAAALGVGRWLNGYQINGDIALAGLQAPVRVVRDAKGMAYIHAENLSDARHAQGFVTAQDRLLQLELTKRAAQGRLAALLGPDFVSKDIESRVIGFRQVGQAQWDVLNAYNKRVIGEYLTGLNAYIDDHADEHPWELRLLGAKPEAWTGADVCTVMVFYAWQNAANYQAELAMQGVVDAVGPTRAAQLAPVVINPEDGAWHQAQLDGVQGMARALLANADGPNVSSTLASTPASGASSRGAVTPVDAGRVIGAPVRGGPVRSGSGMGGSNAWAVAAHRSPNGAPVVANDPHVDPRLLPGFWYPLGIFTPEFRAVGVSAGLPGITLGRSEHLAWGVTNGYADVVDLYIETPDPQDPDQYLNGDGDAPGRFGRRQEVIEVKGGQPVTIVVRSTARGPVVSDHLPGFSDGVTMSLRWAVTEYPQTELSVLRAALARSVDEAVAAWQQHRVFGFSLIIADVEGNIARVSTGAAPVRLAGDGATPWPAVAGENWGGLIPGEAMPRHINPAQGWVASTNQYVGPAALSQPFTTYASANFRYWRLAALLNGDGVVSVDDHAAYQRDVGNVLAQDVAPIMAAALGADPQLVDLATILAEWDHFDRVDSPAPTIFQAIHRHYVREIFADDIDVDRLTAYLDSWYVWQERVLAMTRQAEASGDGAVGDDTQPVEPQNGDAQDGESQTGESQSSGVQADRVGGALAWRTWFDDTRTPDRVETRDDMFRRAAHLARAELSADYGSDPQGWTWGRVRAMRHWGPMGLSGVVGRLTGSQSYAKPGSGETLNRALFGFSSPGFDPKWTASLRMVADLGDGDKVLATMPGGVTGRTLHPWLDNQIPAFRAGRPSYWWFSPEMVEANARSELVLHPSP